VIIKEYVITWTVSIISTMMSSLTTSVFFTCMCYFPIAEKTPGDVSLEHLCGSLSRLATVEPAVLQNWLRHVILGGASPTPASLPTPTSTLEAASPQQSESSTNAATPTGSGSVPPTAAASGKSDTGTQIASSESNSSSHSPTEEHQGLLQENHLLLQGLTAYIVKENR